MGNEMSRLEEEENMSENDPEYAVVQNGSVTLQSAPRVNTLQENDRVDGKQVVQQENVITSSQKTIVISPISNGGDTKPPLPAAKSKFRLTISRPAPGLTTFQANGAEVVSANPEVTSGESIIVQKGTPVVLEATLPKESAGGNQNQSPPSISGTNEASIVISTSNEVETTPSKPKEISIFDRLFRPEKRVQTEVPVEPQVEENQEMITVEQNSGLESVPTSNNPQVQKVDDFKQTAAEVQSSEPASLPASQDQNYSEITLKATQTSPQEEIHPVMSFFKTLVSPNKSVPKSEEEPKNEVDDKSKKEEQQTSGGNVVVEQPVVAVTINAEPPSPDQILTQDTKPTEPNVQPQITAQASKDDGKAAKESTPRPRPFWRKSFKGDPPSPKPQEKSLKEELQESQLTDNVVVEQPVVSVTVNSEKSAPDQILTLDSKPTEPNVQLQIKAPASNDEGKAAKEPSQRPMPFWRKSFKGDPLPPKTQTKSLKEELQEPQLTDNVVLEQPVVSVTVNSEKSTPEQILTLDTKPTEPSIQPQITAQVSNNDGMAAKEPPQRPMPFWRKSFKGDSSPLKTKENVVVEQPVVTVTVNSEKSTPEQILTLDTKPTEPNVQPQITAQASNNAGISAKEPPQRPRPFWRKSFKGDPPPTKTQEKSLKEELQESQLTENVVVEQPVVSVTLNSEKSAPDQILTPDTNTNASTVQPLITAQAANDDGNADNESSQRPMPFWRKSFRGTPQPVMVQENSLKEEPQSIQLTEDASAEPDAQTAKADVDAKAAASSGKAQELQDKSKKPEDGKKAKPKLMMFFKQLTVIGDGGNARSEEVNEKTTDQLTLDVTDGTEASKTEKTVVTAVVEPPVAPVQKSKETPKEKKAAADKVTKQESKESVEVVIAAPQQVVDPAMVQNGGDMSKDGQLKRTEKRQSLGSFFKAIGPKRMCDAEVQTDPVSILPADKVK